MKFKRAIVLMALGISLFLPSVGLAKPCETGSVNNELCNPVEAVGGDNFQTFIVHVLQILAGIAGTVTIIFVMISGARFLISQGNSEQVQTAKRSLQWSLIGFVVMLLAFVLISAISKLLDVQTVPGPAIPDLSNPIKSGSVDDLFGLFITGFFGIAGLLAILMIIVNGFRYITARGDQEQVESAKSGLLYAIIGIVIVLLAYVIVRATATFFGAK